MFTVKEAQNPQDVERILQLRYKVLRAPWNQPIDTATDAIEDKCINAYIEDNKGEVIACGRLQENENKIGQIRFMAVSDDYQGKGLGKLIVQHLEKRGHDLKLKTIECIASPRKRCEFLQKLRLYYQRKILSVVGNYSALFDGEKYLMRLSFWSKKNPGHTTRISYYSRTQLKLNKHFTLALFYHFL